MAVENGEEDGRDGKRRKVYDDESGEFVVGDGGFEAGGDEFGQMDQGGD